VYAALSGVSRASRRRYSRYVNIHVSSHSATHTCPHTLSSYRRHDRNINIKPLSCASSLPGDGSVEKWKQGGGGGWQVVTQLRELVCSKISDFRSWLVLKYLTLGTKMSNFFLPDGAGGWAARLGWRSSSLRPQTLVA
jgi:hypothetical protein